MQLTDKATNLQYEGGQILKFLARVADCDAKDICPEAGQPGKQQRPQRRRKASMHASSDEEGEDEQGEGLVKKETCWVTNSPCIAQELDQVCTNVAGTGGVGQPTPQLWHRHVHLVNHRAHKARIYPPKLVAAILRGTREQL